MSKEERHLGPAPTRPGPELGNDNSGPAESSWEGRQGPSGNAEGPAGTRRGDNFVRTAVREFGDKRIKRKVPAQTGPRTEEGKAAVSQNAVKLGLYARRAQDEEFVGLDRSIRECLGPTGAIQEGIVSSIVFEMWRLQGIERTVQALERGIDNEQVNLWHLADQVGFPFSKEYAPLLLLYQNESDLLSRVRSHCEGLFVGLMAHASLCVAQEKAAEGPGQMLTTLGLANARAERMLIGAVEVLSRTNLVQVMEEKFFQEFDAVMLDARLGNNSLGRALVAGGDLAPLVECWVYRNHLTVRVIAGRMVSSLRLDLLTDPRIERALRTARSRLNSLLRDYVIEAPDKLSKARRLGFWSSEGR